MNLSLQEVDHILKVPWTQCHLMMLQGQENKLHQEL